MRPADAPLMCHNRPVRRGRPPFKFDLAGLFKRFQSLPLEVEATATISLPGFSVAVRIDDSERRVARELVIRLADRRVLNAFECCDGCIDNAMKSIQEIRALLIDKQVQLSHLAGTPLYLLIELMAEPIRQFLTFEESLTAGRIDLTPESQRQLYFDALEMLRAHLHRSLRQIAVIGDMTIPNISEAMHYDSLWDPEAYLQLARPTIESGGRRELRPDQHRPGPSDASRDWPSQLPTDQSARPPWR